MMDDVTGLLKRICSDRKLERDASLEILQKGIDQLTNEKLQLLESELNSLAQQWSNDHWEVHHGCLKTIEILINTGKVAETSLDRWVDSSIRLLDSKESRVRLAAGSVLGVACTIRGPSVYHLCSEKLLKMLNENLELTSNLLCTSGLDETDKSKAKMVMQYSSECCLAETSMRCLQLLFERQSRDFAPFITDELMMSVFKASDHHNRFVREAAFALCSSLCFCEAEDSTGPILGAYEFPLCSRISKGLADDWSQVRMAASAALRSFLQQRPLPHYKNLWIPLLPPMCFNRYHLDAGLRLYSQETWQQIMGTEGKSLVSSLLEQMISFYIEQSHCVNHVVRVTACHALAELIEKMDPKAMKSFTTAILSCLINCFKDRNWMVKDAACLVTASFILVFPDTGRDSLPELLPLFFGNLQDLAQIVRQGAAESLVKIIPSLGAEVTKSATDYVTSGLTNLNLQESSSFSTPQKSGISTVVIKKKTRCDNESLEVSPVSSTSKVGEFIDFEAPAVGTERPPEYWEIADGCVYLLNQLSSLPGDGSIKVMELIPLLIIACKKRDYGHHVDFLETVLQLLPSIAKNVGKMKFKRFLEEFLEIIQYCAKCNCAWTEKAAKECLSQLSVLIGPNIMRGRLEANYPELLVTMGSFADSFS